MQELLWFLPRWPPEFGEPVAFGALLLAGLLGGEIVNRVLALPRITGYVLAGIALRAARASGWCRARCSARRACSSTSRSA